MTSLLSFYSTSFLLLPLSILSLYYQSSCLLISKKYLSKVLNLKTVEVFTTFQSTHYFILVLQMEFLLSAVACNDILAPWLLGSAIQHYMKAGSHCYNVHSCLFLEREVCVFVLLAVWRGWFGCSVSLWSWKLYSRSSESPSVPFVQCVCYLHYIWLVCMVSFECRGSFQLIILMYWCTPGTFSLTVHCRRWVSPASTPGRNCCSVSAVPAASAVSSASITAASAVAC